MKIEKLKPYLHHIEFPSCEDMCVHMLRFQEYTDSPKYRGTIFTFDEFKEWYSKEFGNGKFTYYDDWSGFNISSDTLKVFYEGKFDPLSKEEKVILEKFKDIKGDFYIITTFENYKFNHETFPHEIAHAMFKFEPEYKKEVRATLKKKDFSDIHKLFKEKWCYHSAVFEDETHAFLLTNEELLRESGVDTEKYQHTIRKLKKVFAKYNK